MKNDKKLSFKERKINLFKKKLEEATGKKVVLKESEEVQEIIIDFEYQYEKPLPVKLKQLLSPEDYEKAQKYFNKLTELWQAAYERNSYPTQKYYDGVRKLENFLVKQLKKSGYNVEAGEGDDVTIELKFKWEKNNLEENIEIIGEEEAIKYITQLLELTASKKPNFKPSFLMRCLCSLYYLTVGEGKRQDNLIKKYNSWDKIAKLIYDWESEYENYDSKSKILDMYENLIKECYESFHDLD